MTRHATVLALAAFAATITAAALGSTAHATIDPRLSWMPPTAAGMTTVWVPPNGLDATRDVTKDYELVFPGRANHLGVTSPYPAQPVTPKAGAGCVRVDGGRIVQIIGGECLIPPQPTPYNSRTRRCFAFNDVRYLLFVEGVWCHGDVLDGIEMFAGGGATGATIEIQRSRFEGISARDEDLFTDGHPDGIYLSGAGPTPGARQVRIDRVTVVSDYQAFLFGHPTSGVGANYPVTLWNSNARGTAIPGNHYAQLLWRADPANRLSLSNVYLEPQVLGSGAREPLIKTVAPGDVDPVVEVRAFSVDLLTVGWPAAANIAGVVKAGPPPDGDYCPVGCAGAGYVSPGYRS